MRVSFHPDYFVELPPGHPFPMQKFPDLHRVLLDDGVISRADVLRPREADLDMLRLVHTEEYLWKLATGNLTVSEERRLGIPWSQALWRRSRLAVSGTVNAAFAALKDGCAGNLAGGTHHAFEDHGQGFCVLNDVAICVRHLLGAGRIERALVVDLDVHQGNGTAAVFARDDRVYTLSMHGEKNFPARKSASSLDVGLACGTGDDEYMRILSAILPKAVADSRPDCVFYLAGVDPVEGDRYGRLGLTEEGIRRRDRFVARTVREYGAPLVILLSGGYASTPYRTAQLHAIAFKVAASVYDGLTRRTLTA